MNKPAFISYWLRVGPCDSHAEAETALADLRARYGGALRAERVRKGRGRVWFVYASVVFTPGGCSGSEHATNGE
jgi:hypothetical protein